MRRVLGTLAAAVLAGALVASPAAADDSVTLSPSSGGKFPNRSWVLSLPTKRDLRTSDIDLRENGQRVSDLSVVAGRAGGSSTYGIVLAIDASRSMQGAPINEAMAAARAFVAQRRPDQPVSVVFFNRNRTVALPLTTDQAKIDAAVATVPDLASGTRIYDAGVDAVRLLENAKVRAGSVVMLSDGADVGSLTSPSRMIGLAEREHVRLFTVGLRSGAFDPSSLERIADGTGGQYTEASSTADLSRIYSVLGAQLAKEHVISYRSLAPAGAPVSVVATIKGVDAPVYASYHAPRLELPSTSGPTKESGWASSPAKIVLVAVLALLMALMVWLLVRSTRESAVDRVSAYVGGAVDWQEQDLRPEREPLVRRIERALSRGTWWPKVVEAVDLSGLNVSAGTLVGCTLSATVVLVWGSMAGGRGLAALLFCLLPAIVYLLVHARVERRRREFADQLPDNLQVVASALRAGHSFESGLAVAADDAAEPMRSELKRIVADERLGIPLETAMANVSRRMKSREFEHVGLVVALQRDAGGNTAEILDTLTDSLRYRAELNGLVRTLTAQGRMGGLVVTLLPFGLAFMLALLDPSYFNPLAGNLAGQFLLGVAAVLVGIGWLAIRKIVDIKV